MTRVATLAAALVVATAVAQEFPLPCKFIPDDPEGPNRDDHCAAREEGRIVVSKTLLSKMFLSEDGLARALIDHTWYYIKRDGTTLPVIWYDSGADDFSEGLVRSRMDGKIGYFDVQFRQVIPPKYDWAWPFEGGKALVCIECVESAPDPYCGHTMVEGGRWGYIDRQGREIVSVTHSREEIMKFEKHHE
jgi:WG containing repeat